MQEPETAASISAYNERRKELFPFVLASGLGLGYGLVTLLVTSSRRDKKNNYFYIPALSFKCLICAMCFSLIFSMYFLSERCLSKKPEINSPLIIFGTMT